MSASAAPSLADAFVTHRDRLWGLAYRMLGDPSEAEDVVQDSFAKAVEFKPDPEREGHGLGPWLTTVATRLSIDRLRRRKARAYDGPWLPVPVCELPLLEGRAAADSDPEFQLGARESAGLAVLWALESLDAPARAALLLNGVFGYTSPELAEILGTSAGNVRVMLHRARKTLAQQRDPDFGSPLGTDAWPALLGQMMTAIANDDLAALERLFADDVEVVNDANGLFRAARKVVRGPHNVARFYLGIAKKSGTPNQVLPVTVNGELAFWTQREPLRATDAAETLMCFRVRDAKICRAFSWLAPDKFEHLRPSAR